MGQGLWIILKNYFLMPYYILLNYYRDIGKIGIEPFDFEEKRIPAVQWLIQVARGVVVLFGGLALILFVLRFLALLLTKPLGVSLGALISFAVFYPVFILVAAILLVEIPSLLKQVVDGKSGAMAAPPRKAEAPAAKPAEAKPGEAKPAAKKAPARRPRKAPAKKEE